MICISSFIASYILCSYFIFKPSLKEFINFSNVAEDKKAVIFYCEGEMEKYTPYYSNYFINKKPFFLKPIYAYKIKKIYSKIDINNKNSNLTLVARDVKSSILNYKPYYFYIAYSGYSPSVKDAINSAINDGCSKLTIINYSANKNILDDIKNSVDIDKLKSHGIDISITKSVQENGEFQEYISSKIINMPVKFDGIILVTKNEDIGIIIKSILNEHYKKDDNILITDDIEYGIKHFLEKKANNIIYVCLDEASSGLMVEYYYPKILLKYSDKANIVGIKDWGYDPLLVKSSIKSFLEAEK